MKKIIVAGLLVLTAPCARAPARKPPDGGRLNARSNTPRAPQFRPPGALDNVRDLGHRHPGWHVWLALDDPHVKGPRGLPRGP